VRVVTSKDTQVIGAKNSGEEPFLVLSQEFLQSITNYFRDFAVSVVESTVKILCDVELAAVHLNIVISLHNLQDFLQDSQSAVFEPQPVVKERYPKHFLRQRSFWCDVSDKATCFKSPLNTQVHLLAKFICDDELESITERSSYLVKERSWVLKLLHDLSKHVRTNWDRLDAFQKIAHLSYSGQSSFLFVGSSNGSF
jgi:hypothetical protein